MMVVEFFLCWVVGIVKEGIFVVGGCREEVRGLLFVGELLFF